MLKNEKDNLEKISENGLIFCKTIPRNCGDKYVYSVRELLNFLPSFSVKKIRNIISGLKKINVFEFHGYGKNKRTVFSLNIAGANDVQISSIICPFTQTENKTGANDVQISSIICPSAGNACNDNDQIQFSLSPGQIMRLTVTKVYRYYKYLYLILTMLILNNYNIKTSLSKKEQKRFSLLKKNPEQKFLAKNYPCSNEHYFNSKFVLARLNDCVYPAHRRKPFSIDSENLGPIIEQLKKGATIEDCFYVIELKLKQWENISTMTKYLRPSTLFGKRFFEYLGENLNKENGNEKSSISGRSNSCGKNSASSRAAKTLSQLGSEVRKFVDIK